jgi:prepilin-type N-terminal cleavage/methylation domain-containing protein/prepilin-type processing-associated H-X9-DG protein
MLDSRSGNPRRAILPHGFTLIELLVVVAIIAVLVGIILPALLRAKSVTKRTICASQLRQIFLATGSYLQDHKDVMYWRDINIDHEGMDKFAYGGLVPNKYTDTGNSDLLDVMITLAGKKLRPLNVYMGLGNVYDATLPKRGKVVGNTEIYHCPADDVTGINFSGNALGLTRYEWLGNSYAFNCTGGNAAYWTAGTYSTFLYGLSGNKRDTVRRPSLTLMYGDGTAMDLAGVGNAGWHGDNSNIMMVDGHNAFIPCPTTLDPNYSWSP